MRCNNLNHQRVHNFGLENELFLCRRSGNRVPLFDVVALSTSKDIYVGSVTSVLLSMSLFVCGIALME